MAADYMNVQRQAIPMLPLDRRTGMTEVELVYNEQEAMAEAQRCLKCYINTILEGSEAHDFELEGIQPEELGSIAGTAMIKDETRCIRCGLCALRCPANTITMEAYHLLPSEPTGLITIQSFDGPKPSAAGAAATK